MALVKCPDCEKMISERVEACPFCGCPKEFFSVNKDTDIREQKKAGETAVKKDKKIESIKEIEDTKESVEVHSEKKIEFSLGPTKLIYSSGIETFAAMFGDYHQLADNAKEGVYRKYLEAEDLKTVINTVVPYAQEILNDVVSKSVKLLYDHKIYFTNEQFLQKYTISYMPYVEHVMRQYGQVTEQQKALQQHRESEKESRGRWTGGGFGLKGAIKGAATASVLNMGSDLLHSFGDATKANQDNQLIQGRMNSIYQNRETVAVICGGIFNCIMEVFEGMVNEYKHAGIMKETFNLRLEEEAALYKVTMEHANDDKEKLENLIKCLLYYPGEKQVYEEVIPLIIGYSKDQLGEFLEFWHLQYMYPDYKEERAKAKIFDNFLTQKGADKFHFRDLSPDNYLLMRKWIYEFYETFHMNRMPKYSFYAGPIKELYEHERGTMTFYKTIEWVPLEYDVFQFMECMRKEREGLVNSALPKLWLYGDDISKIPQKLRDTLVRDQVNLLIYYDKSMFANGKNGIAVTTSYLLDLKRQNRIDLAEIDSIECYKDGSIQICGQDQIITFKADIIQDENALNHMTKLLKVICVRFVGNSQLWDEAMSTPKPTRKLLRAEYKNENVKNKSDKLDDEVSLDLLLSYAKVLINIMEKYALKNPDVDEREVFFSFLNNYLDTIKGKNTEIVDIQSKNICKQCGKEIQTGVKFCNYCGASTEEKRTCHGCGKLISYSAKFCNFCGQIIKED